MEEVLEDAEEVVVEEGWISSEQEMRTDRDMEVWGMDDKEVVEEVRKVVIVEKVGAAAGRKGGRVGRSHG